MKPLKKLVTICQQICDIEYSDSWFASATPFDLYNKAKAIVLDYERTIRDERDIANHCNYLGYTKEADMRYKRADQMDEAIETVTQHIPNFILSYIYSPIALGSN